MNSTWQHHLLEAGAVISDGCVSHFGNPRQELQATARGAIIADLSHYGVLRFAGEDAQTFLQGQLCNDIRLVNPDAGQFSGYCSPKGRMLANFLIWQSDADYYVVRPVVPVPSVPCVFAIRFRCSRCAWRTGGGVGGFYRRSEQGDSPGG